MASGKVYIVPVDFSKPSVVALNHAIGVAPREKRKLHVVHVITDPGRGVPLQLRAEYYRELEKHAQVRFEKLRLDRRLKKGTYRFIILKGWNPARLIVRQAKKSRASMIIMGSHGRSGFKRLVLGSVAERIIRYAECPVLIVKR